MAEYAYEQPANGADVDVAAQQQHPHQQYDQAEYEQQQHLQQQQQQHLQQQQVAQQQYEHAGGVQDPAVAAQNGHVSPAPGIQTHPNLHGHSEAATQNGSASNAVNVIRKTLSSWVGFSNLPNQVHRRSVR